VIGCTAQFHRDRITEVRKAWGMNMAFRSDIFHLGCLFRPDFGLRCYGRKGQAERIMARLSVIGCASLVCATFSQNILHFVSGLKTKGFSPAIM